MSAATSVGIGAALLVVAIVAIIVVFAVFPGLITLVDGGRPHRESANGPLSVVGREGFLTPRTAVVFTADQCAETVEKLRAIENRWEKQTIGGVMRTCGRPTYLGAAEDPSRGISNEEMMSLFRAEYSALVQTMRDIFPDTKIVFGGGENIAPNAGVPGFHIFSSSRAFRWPVASLHVDRQYTQAGFVKPGDPPPRRTMSFTILIQEPEGGAGLHIWDVSSEKDSRARGGSYPPPEGTILPLPAWLLVNGKEHHHRIQYELGKIVIHDGHHYHLIAPNSPDAVRERITLQGHGIWLPDPEESEKEILYVYW